MFKFEYCSCTFLFKAFICMNIFTSNRLCFKMAYSDKSSSPYFLLGKKIDISVITVFVLTPWKLAETITDHTTGLEWKFLCVYYCLKNLCSICLTVFKLKVSHRMTENKIHPDESQQIVGFQ